MKVLINFLTGVLLIGLLAGCSKHGEEIHKDWLEGIEEKDAFYVNAKVLLPVAPGTRSQTGEDGTSDGGKEEGQDYENKVGNVLLVLAERGDGDSPFTYIAHGLAGAVQQQDGIVTTTAAITQTTLSGYYEKYAVNRITEIPEERQKIQVFAFCNPPQDLLDVFNKDLPANEELRTTWFNAACEVIGSNNPDNTGMTDGSNRSIWAKNSFLMSSSETVLVTIPPTFDEWLLDYATVDRPLLLSEKPVPVERSVARFDFKDGSDYPGENTYDVDVAGMNGGALQVKLVRMALVNMSKHFYYLKRVSDESDGHSSPVLCGAETDKNHIVDTDAGKKHKHESIEGMTPRDLQLSDYFNFCLFNEDGSIDENTRKGWNNYRIDDVIGGDNGILGNGDKWTDVPGSVDKSGYHIWRYVTENTISHDEYQTHAVSTGIVFKGKLLIDRNNEAVNETLRKAVHGEYSLPGDDGYIYQVDGKTYPILFVYENNIYVGWNDQVKRFISEDYNGQPMYNAAHSDYAYKGVTKTVDEWYQNLVKVYKANGKDAENFQVKEALNIFRAAVTANGFTMYQASDDSADYNPDMQKEGEGPGFYFYYFYWNRHNNNGRNGVMGPMEFAVVRNNVYKLSVTHISQLGHPRISGNDPDNPTPDKPDEEGKLYFTVNVEVLPWTVRVNNIIF